MPREKVQETEKGERTTPKLFGPNSSFNWVEFRERVRKAQAKAAENTAAFARRRELTEQRV